MADISSDTKIALIGCGKMGEAMLSGWISATEQPAASLSGSNFYVALPPEDMREHVESEYGSTTAPSATQLWAHGPFDMVVLAVKPQVMPGVLEELAAWYEGGPQGNLPLFITVAAGIPTDEYEESLGVFSNEGEIFKPHVVRVMPNMPLQIQQGASVLAGGAYATDEEVELARDLFAALGTADIVDESQIDAICAISGGGPAYIAYTIEALREAGEKLGLSAELAEKLALQTLGGTYQLMQESGMTPEEMRKAVCSPGGTTLAAIGALDDAGFMKMYGDAMAAAVNRAKELRG